MPTYEFSCPHCHRLVETVQTIGEYTAHPPAFVCCGQLMDRHFSVAPGLAVVGEKHYEGLRAPDGTPIDTRAKHRAYMKANNLTTVDDFALTWRKDADERRARIAGEDPNRVRDIAEAIHKLGG